MEAWQRTLTPEDIRRENAFRAAQRKAGKSRRGNIKDPNAPKKPLSAYFMFLRHIRDDAGRVRDVFGDERETTAQSVLAAQKWRSMTDEERKVSKHFVILFLLSVISFPSRSFWSSQQFELIAVVLTASAADFPSFAFLSFIVFFSGKSPVLRLKYGLPSISVSRLRLPKLHEAAVAYPLFAWLCILLPFRPLTCPIPLRSRDPG